MIKKLKIFGKEIASWGDDSPSSLVGKIEQSDPLPKSLPGGRISAPPPSISGSGLITTEFLNGLRLVTPDFLLDIIPVIRKLSIINQDLSQALDTMVQLGNTGHTIAFDAAVTPDSANQMRAHLDAKKLEWAEAEAGMDGLVNKMIAQIMISGALSNEWVPDANLKGIRKVAIVNPETIRWFYDKKQEKYRPFQQVLVGHANADDLGLIELNPATYKYFCLNGDTEIPYGIPPYLPSLQHIEAQKMMLDNIQFIVKQAGIMGFLEVLVEKPDILPGESNDKYVARLNDFLTKVGERVKGGYKDGISVGYKGDHEFDFHGTAKSMQGVSEIFNLNETMLSSGLKTDPSMMGRANSSSETQITIIFTKLLSQLKNIQNLVRANLEYGYSLELRLGGFKFNNLTVIFNPSTAIDELKQQQADEIKIRNSNALYADGIIGQQQYAHRHGLEKPSELKPRFLRNNVQTEAQAKQKAEADKNKSDKKVRDKNKPQGSTKNQDDDEEDIL